MYNNKRGLSRIAPLVALLVAAVCPALAADWVPTLTQAFPALGGIHAQEAVRATSLVAGAPVQVAVSLRLRNRQDLESLTSRIKAGQAAQALTPEQFNARFAPTEAQTDAVVAHLRAAGFVNIEVAPNRLLVTADGTAGTVKAAFNTELRSFNRDGQTVYANTSAAMVPKALGDVVLAVQGLNSAATMKPLFVKSTEASSSAGVVGHNPTDFPTIYGVQNLGANAWVTMGIVTSGKMTQTIADLKTFEKQNKLAAIPTSVVNVGRASSDTSGIDEWNLDSQTMVATAGGNAKELIFYTASSLSDADLTKTFNKIVTANKAQVINVSLGECEDAAKSDGAMAADDQIFQQAMAQYQLFTVASGDSGSGECQGSNGQSYPATSPYVAAVGGTTLTTTGTTTYASETAWSGSGGGASLYEAAPAWQISAGVLGGSTMRGVPDLAMDADPASGALITVKGATEQVGGTSLAAPMFAGLWTRLIGSTGSNLMSWGSFFYANATNTTWGVPPMRDITTGSNGSQSAKVGWDYVTGWGSFHETIWSLILLPPPHPVPTPTPTPTPTANAGH
jgi:pseudomonalisin/xanthomonalisin